jgi:hypothetical protein
MTLDGACAVEWDEAKKEYRVTFSKDCVPCRFSAASELAVAIVEASSCSCGGTLRLGSHRIRKTTQNGLELEATYGCPACSSKKRGLLQLVREWIAGAWKSTKKIELGPDGFKYEKKASA